MNIYRNLAESEFLAIQNRILYEDNHYLIVNKLSGEIVQGDKTGDECLAETLKAFIAQRDSKPGRVFMGVAHRLDRPVSGVVLFAKTSKGLERINSMLREGKVHKTYWALLCKEPPSAISGQGSVEDVASVGGWTLLENYLYRNEKQNKSYLLATSATASTTGGGVSLRIPDGYKLARLKYRLLQRTERYFFVEVELLTGRHHQIRAQMAGLGCPIKGDLKYGAPRSNRDGSISLCAKKLEFIHPISGKPVSVEADLQGEMDYLYKLAAACNLSRMNLTTGRGDKILIPGL